MVVGLSVAPEQEAAFNEFYHHQFLPAMLRETPEILSIRRYEELGIGGSLRWYKKQFLTFYELAAETTAEQTDEFFKKESLKDVMAPFGQWKTKSLRNFTRITFEETWESERKAADGPFGSRPFFLWSIETKPDQDASFQDWYENQYLPLQIADIPTWTTVRKYRSIGKDPVRQLTCFEAADENVLSRCLSDLRAPHRVSANSDWQKRVEAAVSWQDASSFRPIYRRPG
jgi:hypothetical protein